MRRNFTLRLVTGLATTALLASILFSLPASASAGSGASTPQIEKVCGPVGAGFARCFAQKLLNPSTWRGTHLGKPVPAPTTSTPQGYWPTDLQNAYGLTSYSTSNATGVTVAIVDAYSNPYLATNLATYRSQFSLPGCTTSSGCLKIVNQSGGSKLPRANSGWGTEESLDVDMVSAICPNCKILVVEASSATFSNLGAAAVYAEQNAQVVSNSYGGSESSGEISYNGDYTSNSAVVVASSGDSGYGVEFPAAAPSVVAAGGTTLTRDTSVARGWTESVWSGAGSGCSAYEAIPVWQPRTSVCSMRTVADASADADPNTGVAVYDTYGQSGWMVVGGTSVASPVIASVFALGTTSVTTSLGSDAAKMLYSAPSGSLYPITSGSNGTCGDTYLCNAAYSLPSGYNGPTGNGTPSGIAAF